MTENTKPVALMTIHEAAKTGIMPENTLRRVRITKFPAFISERERLSILTCLFLSSTIQTTM